MTLCERPIPCGRCGAKLDDHGREALQLAYYVVGAQRDERLDHHRIGTFAAPVRLCAPCAHVALDALGALGVTRWVYDETHGYVRGGAL